MAERTRIPLAEGQELASELIAWLAPYCERIEVAGSIRRRKSDVGDVELVCIPLVAATPAGLFGDMTADVDRLDARLRYLVEDGDAEIQHRLDKNGRPAFGPHYKRLLYAGFPLDVFATTREQWGVIFTIRTGPAEFSYRLVTPRRRGGLLPDYLRVKDGRLWHGDEALDTPEEIDVLNAVRLGWIPPEQRTGLEKAVIAS